MTTFALISLTKLIRTRDLYPLAVAVELGARDCARAWNLMPPAVITIDRDADMHGTVVPILFVDGTEDPTALAEHYWDPIRAGAVARVFVSQASGFKEGPFSVSESTSHEVLESLVNPHLSLWADAPRRHGVQVPVEVCDPVQDSYLVSTSGALWPVSNFVTPAWFRELSDKDADVVMRSSAGFDFKRTLSKPGEVGPQGYVVLRKQDAYGRSDVWTENWVGDPVRLAPDQLQAKSHRLARSVALGAKYKPAT